MKILTITTLCLLSFNTFSKDWDNKDMERKMDKMSFEEAKKMKLDMLDSKTTMIENERKCITAATDKPGLKDCMKQMMEEKKEMHKQMKK